MTAQNDPNPSNNAPTEPAQRPHLPELLETKILQTIDPNVMRSDAPDVPFATPQGHPPRHGLLVFCPHRLVETVWQVKPEELRALGIEGVILDLDNTLVKWREEVMTEEVETWLESVQSLSIRLCILSNSVMGSRSERIAAKLNSAFVRHARKPSRTGFHKSMAAMGTVPANTAIVGDQMFTDILGGNRVGIYTIMVKPIHPREFPYTRYVSRPPEKLLLSYFRKSGKL